MSHRHCFTALVQTYYAISHFIIAHMATDCITSLHVHLITHSLPPSLSPPHSLPLSHTLTPSLTPSLSPPHSLPLSHTLTPSLTPSLSPPHLLPLSHTLTQNLQTNLKRDHKLKHWGRLQYGLFLKGAVRTHVLHNLYRHFIHFLFITWVCRAL